MGFCLGGVQIIYLSLEQFNKYASHTICVFVYFAVFWAELQWSDVWPLFEWNLLWLRLFNILWYCSSSIPIFMKLVHILTQLHFIHICLQSFVLYHQNDGAVNAEKTNCQEASNGTIGIRKHSKHVLKKFEIIGLTCSNSHYTEPWQNQACQSSPPRTSQCQSCDPNPYRQRNLWKRHRKTLDVRISSLVMRPNAVGNRQSK